MPEPEHPDLPRHRDTITAWARGELNLEGTPEPSRVAARFLELLEQEGFVPTESQEVGAEWLRRPEEGTAEAPALWRWQRTRELDEQIALFAAEMLGLEEPERRRRWAALRVEAEGFPRALVRLQQLGAGFDLHLPAEEDLQPLLAALREIFPLRGAARAAKRHAKLLEFAKEIERWEPCARRVLSHYPAWRAVDEPLLARLATWREVEASRAGNRGAAGGKFRSSLSGEKWSAHNPQVSGRKGERIDRSEAELAEMLERAGRTAGPPRGESRLGWFWILLAVLFAVGVARGVISLGKSALNPTTPPRRPIPPPAPNVRMEEFLRQLREEREAEERETLQRLLERGGLRPGELPIRPEIPGTPGFRPPQFELPPIDSPPTPRPALPPPENP